MILCDYIEWKKDAINLPIILITNKVPKTWSNHLVDYIEISFQQIEQVGIF